MYQSKSRMQENTKTWKKKQLALQSSHRASDRGSPGNDQENNKLRH